jgi:hypothetical protein
MSRHGRIRSGVRSTVPGRRRAPLRALDSRGAARDNHRDARRRAGHSLKCLAHSIHTRRPPGLWENRDFLAWKRSVTAASLGSKAPVQQTSALGRGRPLGTHFADAANRVGWTLPATHWGTVVGIWVGSLSLLWHTLLQAPGRN